MDEDFKNNSDKLQKVPALLAQPKKQFAEFIENRVVLLTKVNRHY